MIITVILVALLAMKLLLGGLLTKVPALFAPDPRKQQQRTMADMRAIAAALERHRADRGSYPAGTALPAALPAADRWGTDFRYEATPERYVLTSAGEDREFQEKVDLTSRMATANYGRDIVLVNGRFMQYPEGLQ